MVGVRGWKRGCDVYTDLIRVLFYRYSGQKDILHLEAFCAKMMAVYKQYLMEQFSF